MYERAEDMYRSSTRSISEISFIALFNSIKFVIKMFRQALALSPSHANTLYNYAVMLDTHCGRKAESEVFLNAIVIYFVFYEALEF